MHDIKLIRENPTAFDAGLGRRGLAPLSPRLLEIDQRRRAAQTEFQALQARRNEASRQIGMVKKQGGDAAALMDEVAALKDKLSAAEAEEKAAAEEIDRLLLAIPNLPAADVPDGRDEAANVELRRVGQPRVFDFTPREHDAIGETLGMMDFAAAAKLSGARFVVLKGPLARLERALAAFMLDLHTGENGYTEINPPFLVRDEALYGTGQLPKFGEDLFRLNTGHWLIPTAEVPLTNLVNDASDPVTHRIILRANVVDEGHDLRSQMLADFNVVLGESIPSPAIPTKALVRESDGSFSVWVTTPGGTQFTKRTVQVGEIQEDYAQILDGLRVGEVIAQTNALFLSNLFVNLH